MKKQDEYKLQCQFVQWMTMQHKSVIVFSDTAAHIRKTMIQQIRANALQSPGIKWPDVFVARPSGEYAGLLLEFKAKSPYKADGVTLLKNDHIQAQADTMALLSEAGYQCHFVWSLEQAMSITNQYLNDGK
jgi:hypothetical protein